MQEEGAPVSAEVQQFQVDLRGVVDLLSRHIYSSPRVYLRELLQNARDAITARREVDGSLNLSGVRDIRRDKSCADSVCLREPVGRRQVNDDDLGSGISQRRGGGEAEP